MELDLTGAACMVFQHGSSGRVNIIYRRPDGNVGWVDPPAVKSGGLGRIGMLTATGTPPYGPPPLREGASEPLSRDVGTASCVGVEAPQSGPGISPSPASSS